MAGIADINVKVGAYLKPLDQGLQKAEKDLRRFGTKMTDLGAQLSTTLSAAFAGAAIASVKAYGEFERLEKGLAAVTKSAVPVNEQIDRLKTLAEAPGLGFEQAVTASTRLQAVGFSAQFAEKTIKEVANAVATTGGTADNFDSVLKQFTQMIAKGKLLQEDLGIIQENMPLVSQAIEKAFGTTNVEKIRASGVSTQEFVQKIVGELSNFKRVEGGLSNSMDNLGQSVRFFFASVGKEINEAFNLQERIDGLSDGLNRVSEWFSGLDENVQRNIIRFGLFVAAVGPALFVIGKMVAISRTVVLGFQAISGAVKGLGAAMTFLSGPVGIITAAVAALAVGGIYLAKNWDSAKATFINIWIKIKNTVLGLVADILKGIDRFTSAATFGAAGTNFAEKFSFKAEQYVDVPEWKTFGATMKEVGNDLLQYAGLAGKAKKETQELNQSIFSGDTGPAISGGDPATGTGTGAAAEKVDRIGVAPTIQPGGNVAAYAGEIAALTEQTSLLNAKNIELKTNQDALAVAMANNYTPSVLAFKTEIENLGLAFNSITQKAMPNFTGAVSDGLGAFASYAQKGIGSFKDLAKGVVGASAVMVKTLIRQGVVAAVTNALGSAPGPLGIALAVAAGAAAEGIFNGLLSKFKVPALASGGVAHGETMAIVGDYPSANVDPEVIQRASKIKSIIADAIPSGGFGDWVLRGEDLLTAVERAQARKYGRIV